MKRASFHENTTSHENNIMRAASNLFNLYYLQMKDKSQKLLIITLLAFLPILNSCMRTNESGWDNEGNLYGTVSISGAFAMYPLTVKWAEEFKKEHPKVRIDISAGGAGKGMVDVLSGIVDLAMVSREINEAEINQGALFFAVAKDAVVPVFNSNNPYASQIRSQGITLNSFKDIFMNKNSEIFWNDYFAISKKYNMNVYNRSDACGAAETWAKYLGGFQENLKGIGVFGDPGIAEAVKNDKSGIGYNNICYVYDINTGKPFPGLEVVPIDLNSDGIINPEESFYSSLSDIMNAVSNGLYPSPPSRNLFFVSKGQLENIAAIEFLNWILNEGQSFVSIAGYVSLPEELINIEKQKLHIKPIHE